MSPSGTETRPSALDMSSLREEISQRTRARADQRLERRAKRDRRRFEASEKTRLAWVEREARADEMARLSRVLCESGESGGGGLMVGMGEALKEEVYAKAAQRAEEVWLVD